MSQLKNFIWMTSTKIISLLVVVIVTGLTARYLGTEDFGVLALAISFANLLNAFISMGMPHLLSSKFISHPRAAESVLVASALIRFIFTCIAYPFLLFVFWVFYKEYFWILLFATSGCLFFALDVFEVYFDSKKQSKKQAIPQLISRSLSEFYRVGLILFNVSLFWFALFLPIWFALSFFTRLAVFVKSIKLNQVKIKRLFLLMRYLFKTSLPLIISTMSIMIYMQSDRLMIEHMLGTEQLGLYAAAATLSNAWLIVPTSIAIALLPNIISNIQKKTTIDCSDLTSFFRLVFLVSVSIAFILFLLSDFLILIIFGTEFSYASTLLNIMLISACLSVYGLSANRVLIALNYRRFCMYKAVFTAVINVVANYFLIKQFGVIGAAFGTLIAELISSLILNFIVKNGAVGRAQIIGVFTCIHKASFRDVNSFIKGSV